ncbi:MAG: 4-hydroxythreonine-4-phosphate dehydrogenase PdxA [Gammaproteobacteria bacterium]|nr:4-hydroxythreonine-4-phosphate dehydrogenase PdxA [Gammaproteobacteria bacterium]
MKARVCITMGDPSGVGPEVICKALQVLTPEQRAETVVLGNAQVLERANLLVKSSLGFSTESPSDGSTIRVIHLDTPCAEEIEDCVTNAGSGHAAYEYVCAAVDLATSGQVGAIVTAPLNKSALHLAGHHYDGHTGLLQHLTNTPSAYMLLASEKLSCIHVTTHVSLADAVRGCQIDRIVETIRAGDEHLKALGNNAPRIAVAGLNPHSGEGGIFGREEIDVIIPAVELALGEGRDVSGPLPGDSVFLRASRGEFDLVVAQYHDQGHIPTKLIAFDAAVNVSLGLPIRRTSVDHGTAFDIAWTGRADHTNMLAALEYARRMTPAG